MKTISQAVREVLERSPFLAQVLEEGVANHAQVARRLRAEVEKLLYEEVSESAIAMALHRLSKERRKSQYGASFLKRLDDITVRSGLVEFIFENSSDSSHLLETIAKNAQGKGNSFLNYSRGLTESIAIVSSDLEAHAQKTLQNLQGLRIQKGLSAITMRLPQESLVVPGVYAPILKALAFDGINLIEVMSVLTEFSVIIEDRDVDRAFSAIKKITK